MAAAGGSKQPKTIREMLLWLHGLKDKTSEREKLEEYIGTTLKDSLNGKFSSVSTTITKITAEAKKLITGVCNDAGKIIVSIQNGKDYNDKKKAQQEQQKNQAELESALKQLEGEAKGKNFEYKSSEEDLYNQFLYYLTCCYWQLRFLCLRCNAHAEVGGWRRCEYGQDAPESSDACKNSSQQSNHQQRCSQCSSSDKYSGCLMTFLTEGIGGSAGSNIYSKAVYNGQCPQGARGSQGSPPCKIPPMGFDKNKLPSSDNKQGIELYNALIAYFGNGNNKNFPKLLGHLKLLDLLQHNANASSSKSSSSSSSKALTFPPTWKLPELFAFWAAFREEWNKNGQKSVWKKKFDSELNGQGTTQYKWSDTPGTPESLLEALFKKYNDKDASEHNNTSQNHNVLSTLIGCEVKNSASGTHCGKYLHGILELPFKHVCWRFQNGQLFASFMTSDTVKHFAEKFKEKLEEFQKELEAQQCVKENKCTCIVYCDATHAFLYRNGLTLNSSASLAVKKSNGDDDTKRTGVEKRKCSDLKEQLEAVLSEGAPLNKLTQLSKEVKTTGSKSVSSGSSSAPAQTDPESKAKAELNDMFCGLSDESRSSSTVLTLQNKLGLHLCSGAPQALPQAAPSQTGSGAGGNPGPGGASSSVPVSTTDPGNSSQGPTVAGSGAVTGNAGPGGGKQDATATTSSAGAGGDTPGASPTGPAPPVPPTSGDANQAVTAATPNMGGVGSATGSGTGSPTGTVHSTDNNRDGLDYWNTFRDISSNVLKELKDSFRILSKSAIDAIGTTSQYILKEINAHHSSLLEPPCNVKECLEWLDRVCTNGNKDCQCQASRKTQQCKDCMALDLSEALNAILPGLNNNKVSVTKNTVLSVVTGASALFNAIKGPNYQPAYKLSAKWPVCGPATGGVQCRSCKGNSKCQCSTASSSSSSSPCDGTCCHRCDVRICAGIFIAMVPALHRALEELKKKCNESGTYSKSINEPPIKEMFEALGYEDKDLSNTTWSTVQSKLSSSLPHLGTLKGSIKNAFEGQNRTRNFSTPPCYFQAAKNSTTDTKSASSKCAASVVPSSVTCSTPRTIREMLLWLMGLPYCEGYKQFVDTLQKKYEEHNKSLLGQHSSKPKTTANNNNDYHLHRQYSSVIFQLPVLFFTVEADVSYLRDTFCQFTGDDKNCKTGNTHCTTGTDTHCTTGSNKNCTVVRFRYERCGCCLLRTFCAIVAVLYPVQRFLFKRCEAKSTASRAAERRAIKSRSKQTAPDKDCCAPCPTGLDDWSQLCVKGPSRDCKNSNDSSCCKGNKNSTPCTTSTVSSIRSACQCRALYDFVCFMGFRVGKSVGLRGTVFHVVLRDCFGDQDEEDIGSESVTRSRPAPRTPTSNRATYVKLASCWRLSRCVLRSHCQKGESSPVGCDECSSKCSAPGVQDNSVSQTSSTSLTTIRQMMLWLIGLPLTEAYKKDQDTVPTGGASGPSASGPTASPCYLFGPEGCVSRGVQCIPALKKLEENNDKAQRKAPKEKSAKDTISYDRSFKLYYKESIVWMLVVFNAIEGGLTSVLCYLKGHAPGTGAPHCTKAEKEASSVHVCSKFTYEFKDPSELLRAFCRYIYKVHFQLRFLLVMCSTPKADGGWSQCIYSNKGYATVSGIVCRCSKIIDIPCNNSPLRHFLNSTDKKNKFQLCDDNKNEHLQMGFAVRECSSSLTGANIATVLEALIDPIHTSSSTAFTRPLSLLAQYCVAIGPLDPSSLGDLFTMFGELGVNTMWMTMYLYGKEGQTFSRMFLCELWSVFKCCQEGCTACSEASNEKSKERHKCLEDCKDSNRDCAWRYCRELKESISSIMARHKDSKTANDSKNSKTSNDSDASHRYSLSSLMCTGTTNTGASSTPSPESPQSSPHCTPYLKSLSQGLYTYYCPSVPGAGDSTKFGALQWLYDRLRQLLDGMKKLKEAFEKCHEKNKNDKSHDSSQSYCSDIVSCQYAHPTIYSFGFMLGSPEALKGNNNTGNCQGEDKKNCASFLQQLACVLKAPEGCPKEKCSVLCCQRSSVPSQDAPQACSSSPVSALYLAFECIIDIVYRIMLKKALLRVQCTVEQWYKECNKEQQQQECNKDNENALQCQLTGAFSAYVTNAMYCSYPALMCTFACQVFKENGNSVCDDSSVSHASRVPHSPCVHRAPGPRITTGTSQNRDCCKLKDNENCSNALDFNASLCISKSPVTSITAVIPQYCPTAIDPYHYRVMTKIECCEDCKGKKYTEKKALPTTHGNVFSTSCYTFESALDFHVEGANCILPVPSNLRAAVDWLLRITVGALATGATATKEKENNCAVVCQERNNCDVGQQGDPQSCALCCDPELVMFQCLAEEISCVLNGGQKDAEKKQCDQKDSDAVSTCNTSSTVPNTCAQCLLRNLAQGLRTFVGYKDVTQEVKGEVSEKKAKVRGDLCFLLECLKGFMCNEGVVSSVPSSQCSLVAEFGNALLKGRYSVGAEGAQKSMMEILVEHIGIAIDNRYEQGTSFKSLVSMFSTVMTSEHKQCDSELKCNILKDCNTKSATTTANTCAMNMTNTCANNNCVPQGLSLLCEFFQGIQRFACEWDHIGKGSEAQECKKKGEQLQCCSQDSQSCSQSSSCYKLCPFAPSSDVVFNERRKAECLPWKFEGHKKDECDKKNCSQDCPCKEPKGECSSQSHSSSHGFFQQLQCGLEALGQCAQKVSELCNVNNSATVPATGAPEQCSAPTAESSPLAITQYRHKICDLIQALKRFGEHIEGCKFEGAPEGPKECCQNVCALTCNVSCQDGDSQSSVPQCSASCCSCRADPSYAVDGAKKLMEKTKRGVEKEITMYIKTEISNAYGLYGRKLRLASLLCKLESRVCHTVCVFRSHLDDLKRLCQWLYRMGQLYAGGLRGFVESLVKHLEHIIQVIDWITGIERMIRNFGQECVSTAAGLLTVEDLKCIPACCQRHKRSLPCEASVPTALCDPCTSGTVRNDSAPSSTASNTCVPSPSVFFDALNCRIDSLLSSYVLGPLPTGTITQNDSVCSQGVSPSTPGAATTVDRSDTFRAFLERLRLLALDRYTLQLWQDESCPKDRVSSIRHWSVFRDGIVRHSDLEGIKKALCSLTLMEPYRDIKDLKGVRSSSDRSSSSKDGQKDSSVQCSNVSSSAPRSGTISSTAPPSASHRIHDFHAICVIQKFSYEAPIKLLERSLKELEGIKDKLSAVKEKCNEKTDLSSDDPDVTSFCKLVDEFLQDPYGIYSLAKFLHTIMGPNIFSAVIAALEELTTDKLNGLSNNDNKNRFSGIVKVMTEGLDGENNKEHYKLDNLCEKLTEFITTLRREYIFCYPVVCGIESDKDCKAVCPGECDTQCPVQCSVKSKDTSLVCPSQSSVTDTDLTSASSTVSLTSPMPLLCPHCHLRSSICPQCIPLLARIFITLVPILYPQLCYLAYQCRLYWCARPVRLLSTDKSNKKELSSLLQTFGYDNDILQVSSSGLYFIGDNVWSLLCNERNSLRLLCHNFTKESNVSPFNTESPLFKLYHLCLAYYQRRKNERLTHTSSTTPVTPTTLRQILRFFVYLPFSSQFDDLKFTMQRYCNQSCVVNFSDLFTTMMMSSAMSAVLLQLIECPQGAFLRFFDEMYTNKEGLYLDFNTETLFFQLCDLSVTLYRSLKFLSLQCSADRSLAGWKDCRLRGARKDSDDNSKALDTQQLQLCAPHLCQCPATGDKDSSTTARMCLTAGSTVSTSATQSSTQPSHTTCSLPLLRYLTDADCFFESTLTIPSALRKVCLNDSCQEMIYRHMAPRGWQKERLQCTHRDEQLRDSQLEVCDPSACYSVCHLKDSDLQRRDHSNCGVCCCHLCCCAVCSTLYGHHLFHLLRNFVGHEHDADPLLQFTRYMVSIAAWPPDSLSGYMTFMLRFTDQLRKEERDTQRSVSVSSVAHGNTSQKNGVNSSVLSSLRSEISLFPGEFDPKCLIDAFLKVTHCEHNNGAAHTVSVTPVLSSSAAASSSSQCPTSSGTTISVLRDCKDCNYYNCIIYPLDYEVYDLYLPMYARRYLTWMLHFGPRLHIGLRALEKEFKRHIGESSVSQSAVSTTDPSVTQSGATQSRTSVPCHSSVLHCPFAFPELHSAGLHFWDPEKMCNEKNKMSCKCFLERLHCTLEDSSPLAEFLRQCDSFLWSVRKPFYWLTMALWIVATVYLLFVHLWRLDLARLLSHVIRSRASHLVYPKVLLAAEHSYERYYAPR